MTAVTDPKTPAARPLLVLDIDGVLNSTRSMLLTGPRSNDDEHLDPVAVALLDRVCEAANPNVVIISTWRDAHPDPSWWGALFARYQAPHVRVVACLPKEVGKLHRGRLLQTFLDRPPFEVGPVAVLDDSGDYHDHHPLVQVDPDVGLSADNACDLLDLLAPGCALVKQWRWWMPDPEDATSRSALRATGRRP